MNPLSRKHLFYAANTAVLLVWWRGKIRPAATHSGCKRRPKWVPGALGHGWATLSRGFYWWGWESCCPACQISWPVWVTAYRVPAVRSLAFLTLLTIGVGEECCTADLTDILPMCLTSLVRFNWNSVQGCPKSVLEWYEFRASLHHGSHTFRDSNLCPHLALSLKVCVRDLHSFCTCSESGHREGRTLLAGGRKWRAFSVYRETVWRFESKERLSTGWVLRQGVHLLYCCYEASRLASCCL